MGSIIRHSKMIAFSDPYFGSSMYAQMNFSLNQAEIQRLVRNKVNTVKEATDDRKEAMNTVLRRSILPYEPFDSGELSTDVDVSKYGIYYNAYNESTFFPYPTALYINKGNRYHIKTTHHPKATDHWDVVAWSKPHVRSRVIKSCGVILEKKVRGK